MAQIIKTKVYGGRVIETFVDRHGEPINKGQLVVYPLDEARRIASSLNDRRDSKARRNSEALTLVSYLVKA